jgi:N-acetylglucosamine-6-phosphate deacetylase
MTRQIITGARILSDEGWRDDHALVIAGGCIEAIIPVSSSLSSDRIDLGGGMLLPGFIDTQVNGGGGALFNDDPSVETIATIAAAHRRFGTTGFLPTLISDDLSVIERAIAAVEAAIAAKVPGVLGIHIEGPFLNAGKRGIHDADKFRVIDDAAIELLASLKTGVTLATLAPELAGKGAIAKLVAHGILIAAGHSLATYEQMQSAKSEGLRGVTHLFNAMTQFGSRAPGIVGAALEGGLISGIIVDGHHVHPATLRAAFAAMGAEQLMLVTDAMPSVGSGSKQFTLVGQDIIAEGGACRAPNGTLAGSDLDMAMAVRNAVSMMNVDLAQASRMASGTPAAFLGMGQTRGRLAPGLAADMVHLDEAMMPQSTWIAGQRT